MPMISVIVPVYKVEKYIHRCVDSILGQTYADFELILVDDGSPDNCGAICDEYAAKDSRVVGIHQENGGVSSARNTGLRVAAGKYVVFVDSDDYVAEDYLSDMYTLRCDLVICGQVIRNVHGDVLWENKHPNRYFNSKCDIDYVWLYKELTLYSPYCKLFCNETIQNNNIRFPVGVTWGEDGMFVADYLAHVSTLCVTCQVGYHYIKYNDNSSLSTKIRPEIIEIITKSREYCIERMKSLSPLQWECVRSVCQADIRRNCAYFVERLLAAQSYPLGEKIILLEKFLKNPYVQETMENPGKYYVWGAFLNVDISNVSGNELIWHRRKAVRRQQIKSLLFSLYDRQPACIKGLYRWIKQKLHK